MQFKRKHKHNPSWLQIPDYPYRLLMIEGSGSGKLNSFFNLKSHQPSSDKIYLCTKDPDEAKY